MSLCCTADQTSNAAQSDLDPCFLSKARKTFIRVLLEGMDYDVHGTEQAMAKDQVGASN